MTFVTPQFSFNGSLLAHHASGILYKFGICEGVRQVRDGAPEIGWLHVEEVGNAWRVAFDAQLAIQEERADIRCREQILEIAMCL